MNLLILISIGWPPNGQEKLATQTWLMDHSITSVALFALSIFWQGTILMDVHVTLASKDCICYLILMFYSLFQNIFSLTGLFFDNFVCDHLNYCLLRSGSKCPYFCNLQVTFKGILITGSQTVRLVQFFCTVIFGLDKRGNSEHMTITEFERW